MVILTSALPLHAADFTNVVSGGYNANVTWGGSGNPGNTNIADSVVILNGGVNIQFAYAASNDTIRVQNLGNFTNLFAFGLSGSIVTVDSGGWLVAGNVNNSLTGAVVRLNGGVLAFTPGFGSYGEMGLIEVWGNSVITNSTTAGSTATIHTNASLDFVAANTTLTLAGNVTGGGGITYRFNSAMVSNNATIAFAKTGLGGGALWADITNLAVTAGNTLLLTNRSTTVNSGQLTISGDNAGVAGAIRITSGVTLIAATSNALGSATVMIDGGTLRAQTGFAIGATNQLTSGGWLLIGNVANALTNVTLNLNGGVAYFDGLTSHTAYHGGAFRVLSSSTLSNMGLQTSRILTHESLDFTGSGVTLTLAGSNTGGTIRHNFQTVTITNNATLVLAKTNAVAAFFGMGFADVTLGGSRTLIVTSATHQTGTLAFSGSNPNLLGNIRASTAVTISAESSNALGRTTVTINGGTLDVLTGFGLAAGTTNIINAGLVRLAGANNTATGAVLRLNNSLLHENWAFGTIAPNAHLEVRGNSVISNLQSGATTAHNSTYRSLDFTGAGSSLTIASDITTGPAKSTTFNEVTVTNNATVVLARFGIGAGSQTVQFTNVTITAGRTLSVTNRTNLGGSQLLFLGSNPNLSGNLNIRADAAVAGISSNAFGGGSLFVNGGTLVLSQQFALGSAAIIVSNGTALGAVANLTAGGAGTTNRASLVTGAGAVWTNISSVIFGFSEGRSNSLTVANRAGLITGGALTVGSNSVGHVLSVTNHGFARIAGVVNVGGATGTDNQIFVGSRGLLEANTLIAGTGTGNTISNVGGIFQFTTGTPTVTPNGAGRIAVTDGIISYRATDEANIYNAQVANIAFAGANTFRLNAASNTTSISQNYTFNTGLGAANYTRLEMIEGHTAYRNGNITIGAGGSLLASNTQATISGTFTNLGAVTFLNSVGTFAGAVHNNGAWITDPTTNIFLSAYIIGAAGYISADNQDVFIFRSNLVNESTQNGAWNTQNTAPGTSGETGTKFIFDNPVANGTQVWFHAGLLLTGGFTNTPAPVATGVQSVTSFADVTGFQNNFALDRLEIGQPGTDTALLLSDAFVGDDETAALFVNDLWIYGNSQLILSNNVRLYFVNSNNWSLANVTLLGNAEIHQLALIPEPSTLLFLITGAFTLWRCRRRRPQA